MNRPSHSVIMVVDDDPLFLRILTALTDMQMPGMDGLELVRALRANKDGALIPIIAVTGSTDDAVRREALEAGVTDFLTKPLDRQETRARCRNLLAVRHVQRALADRAAWLAAEARCATETVVTREREPDCVST